MSKTLNAKTKLIKAKDSEHITPFALTLEQRAYEQAQQKAAHINVNIRKTLMALVTWGSVTPRSHRLNVTESIDASPLSAKLSLVQSSFWVSPFSSLSAFKYCPNKRNYPLQVFT